MKSRVTEDFVACFRRLPADIQELARKNYRLWQTDPSHPGLQFKRVNKKQPIYSVRIGINWRALGLLEEDGMTWFWIGPHAEYDKFMGG